MRNVMNKLLRKAMGLGPHWAGTKNSQLAKMGVKRFARAGKPYVKPAAAGTAVGTAIAAHNDKKRYNLKRKK